MRVDHVQTALTSLVVFLLFIRLNGKAVNGSEFGKMPLTLTYLSLCFCRHKSNIQNLPVS